MVALNSDIRIQKKEKFKGKNVVSAPFRVNGEKRRGRSTVVPPVRQRSVGSRVLQNGILRAQFSICLARVLHLLFFRLATLGRKFSLVVFKKEWENYFSFPTVTFGLRERGRIR
ncbi:hypothetical protein CEXT_361601 [Caerostris extrusa]|uniref:Uncharacterized protein n=1 Tax=Caerostris extrusa TaxID=172846 RepID=A0AAV4WH09_CAEEX|nr:hypothetical protein CEXT_361601 [Caerostris extrusa]